MIKKLAAAGFTASRAHSNIGHNPWRMTFVARHAFGARLDAMLAGQLRLISGQAWFTLP